MTVNISNLSDSKYVVLGSSVMVGPDTLTPTLLTNHMHKPSEVYAILQSVLFCTGQAKPLTHGRTRGMYDLPGKLLSSLRA